MSIKLQEHHSHRSLISQELDGTTWKAKTWSGSARATERAIRSIQTIQSRDLGGEKLKDGGYAIEKFPLLPGAMRKSGSRSTPTATSRLLSATLSLYHL